MFTLLSAVNYWNKAGKQLRYADGMNTFRPRGVV